MTSSETDINYNRDYTSRTNSLHFFVMQAVLHSWLPETLQVTHTLKGSQARYNIQDERNTGKSCLKTRDCKAVNKTLAGTDDVL